MAISNSKIKKLYRLICWQLIHLGPKRDITVETYNGLLSFSSKDWLIGKYLYLNRAYETDEIKDVMEFLHREGYLKANQENVVLDVGANIGMISIALLKHGYFNRAISFEPTPDTYRLLKLNIDQNGLSDRMTSYQCALSSSEGESVLELSADNSGDNRVRKTNMQGAFKEESRKTVKVPVKTLDQIMSDGQEQKNHNVSLIWADIQGHEGHFFLGAKQVIKKSVPALIEFWPYAINRSGMSRLDFCSIVSDLYTHYYIYKDRQFIKHAVSDIDSLFDIYNDKRSMCLLILINTNSI